MERKLVYATATLLCCLASAQQPQSWTSHDKLALTYYFYWYNVHTGAGFGTTPGANGTPTLHPPDSYLSTYAWTDVAFHQRELSDMTAAGVDVVLPTYDGSDPSPSGWAVPGLQTMVKAAQAMTQAGQPVPRIGMFYGYGQQEDLTTAAGKSSYYSGIHTFFTIVPKQFWALIDGHPIVELYLGTPAFVKAFNQSTFDYIAQQFQIEFGTTPYIIRNVSWTGIKADAAYTGWGSAYDAWLVGDVATIGPGFDNLGVDVFEGRHIIVDRYCGDRYQQQWDKAISRGARLMLLETWNELFEGTGVSATKEYGRRYIDLTARNVSRWKSSTNLATTLPTMLWASLGTQDNAYSAGVEVSGNWGGGAWTTTRIAGHDAMYTYKSNVNTQNGNGLFLNVDDRFLPTVPAPVWMTVEYLDSGGVPWNIEYDGATNPYTFTAPVSPQNTGLWKRQTFLLPDAMFQKREGVADFGINDFNSQGAVHYFNRIWITKSAPTGGPPEMPLLPDITVQPGSSTDIALTVSDAFGNSLRPSLALNPGFAALQGSTGAEVVHLAPSATDVRSCADVPGPGVTSSPAYTITAVATDPNSQLPGATSFHVTVSSMPTLNLSAPALAFSAVAGSTLAVANTLSISNSAGASFQSTVSTATQSGGNWLQWQPGASASAGKVNLQIVANPAGLTTGTYLGSITITAPALDQSPRSVPVTLTMLIPGNLAVSGRSLSFSAPAGTDPQPQTLAISNAGPAGSVLNWTASVSTATGAGWLAINPASGTDSTSTQVSARAALLAAGSYSGTITITSPGAQNSPVTVAVTLNVVQPPVAQAIVDSWGYTAGIAPGTWVTIGGRNLAAGNPQTWNLSGGQQLPTTLGGVTITFNGTPAALYYVSATQINALVPASIAPGPVQVLVQSNGVSSAPFMITATATQPAVYSPPNADGSTFFVTAALQGTGFLVGNSMTDPRVVRAAYPGDILDLYMIGLGATADASRFVTDRVFSGAFPVSAPVTATVGGEPAQVIFAGLTSPGLYLVRVPIPSDLAAGPQAIQISAGGVQTRSSLVLMVSAAPANLLRNGSFESPLTGDWQLDVHTSEGAAATLQRTTSTSVDGTSSVQISVTSAATSPANIGAVQFFQTGFPIQQGQVYTLQFWGKADTGRTMQFNVVQNGGTFQNYGLNTTVALGGDWQRYVIYFRATVTDPAARVDFYFGGQTGTAWLDNAILQE